MTLLIDNITILDLTTQLPGPYCSMLLGDLGAEVLKLERPGAGDPSRFFPPYFQSANRNKKSSTLNMRTDAGKEIFFKLAENADVVMEGFRPGVTARLGVHYQAVKEVNEKVVYCSISGYGQDGPYADFPGYDINYQGVAGLLRIGAGVDQPPRSPDVWIGDLSSGMFSAISIIAALFERERSGKGQYIDVSMTDGLVSWANVHAGFETTDEPEPAYRSFQAGDGRYITLGVSRGEPFWDKMWVAMGFQDPLRAEPAALKEIISEKLKEKPASEWLEIFRDADVPCGPVNSPDEAAGDPQLVHRKTIVPQDHPHWGSTSQVRYPALFSRTPARISSAPPTLGEHTEETLSSIGYSSSDMEKFRAEGVT